MKEFANKHTEIIVALVAAAITFATQLYGQDHVLTGVIGMLGAVVTKMVGDTTTVKAQLQADIIRESIRPPAA